MKNNNIATAIILLVLMLQIMGCKKEEPTKKNNAVSEKVKIEPAVTDTVFDRKSPYYSFIQKNHPEALKNELSFFKEKDLDLDGQSEALIAFEDDSDGGSYITNIFVLKKDNGFIREIVCDFGLKNYDLPISNIDLVLMQNKKQSYIYLSHSYGPQQDGFSICELSNNKIELIYKSQSANKEEYSEVLIDADNDGQYDGLVQHQELDSGEYTDHFFTFDNGVFTPTNNPFLSKNYPSNAQGVVCQYINLKASKFSSVLIEQRLQQLCIDNSLDNDQINQYMWAVMCHRTISGSDKLETIKNSDTGMISLTGKYYDINKGSEFKVFYELHKSGEKWQITKIELIK